VGRRFEPLDAARHNRAEFRSGVTALDHYLAAQADQDARRRICATFCLVDEDDAEAILGYCTLAAGAVRLTGLPPEIRRRLPRYPDVPVYLIGRLAVHENHQGRGLGTSLLHNALGRILQQDIPAWAVIVDAIDVAAAQFYERHGFAAFPHQPLRLLLPLATIPPDIAPEVDPLQGRGGQRLEALAQPGDRMQYDASRGVGSAAL